VGPDDGWYTIVFIAGQSRRLLDPSQDSSTHVAFHAASVTVHSDLEMDDVVTFDTVFLNLGDGFHASHSLFIAPEYTGFLHLSRAQQIMQVTTSMHVS